MTGNDRPLYLIDSMRDSEYEVLGVSTDLARAIEVCDAYGPDSRVQRVDLTGGLWTCDYENAVVVHRSPDRPTSDPVADEVGGWMSGAELPDVDGTLYERVVDEDGTERNVPITQIRYGPVTQVLTDAWTAADLRDTAVEHTYDAKETPDRTGGDNGK